MKHLKLSERQNITTHSQGRFSQYFQLVRLIWLGIFLNLRKSSTWNDGLVFATRPRLGGAYSTCGNE